MYHDNNHAVGRNADSEIIIRISKSEIFRMYKCMCWNRDRTGRNDIHKRFFLMYVCMCEPVQIFTIFELTDTYAVMRDVRIHV